VGDAACKIVSKLATCRDQKKSYCNVSTASALRFLLKGVSYSTFTKGLQKLVEKGGGHIDPFVYF
jgi:hypothetical protein